MRRTPTRARRPIALAMALALAGAGCQASSRRPPVDPSRPVSAGFARYEYHYDRNAFVSSALVGSALLAVTEAGHLLRFDGRTFALTGELLSARKARFVVASGTNTALVAFQSGRIALLDIASLELRTIAVVPGVPVWLGSWQKDRVVVVYGQPEFWSWSWFHEDLSVYRVRELASGRDVLLDEKPSAFLLDDRDRLWMGADYGEWGGALQVLELTSGKVDDIPDAKWNGMGIYGFAEPEPGVVWALGGVSHMLLQGAFIARVAPRPVTALYQFQDVVPLRSRDQKRWLAASEPRAALTHAFRMPTGDYWLLSQHHWIEADTKLRRFRRLAELSLNNVSGRPDAVGNYARGSFRVSRPRSSGGRHATRWLRLAGERKGSPACTAGSDRRQSFVEPARAVRHLVFGRGPKRRNVANRERSLEAD